MKKIPTKLITQTLRRDIYITYQRISKQIDKDKNGTSPDQSNAEDSDISPVLSVMTDGKVDEISSSALMTGAVVPGKGPPPEPPTTCCMSGCANCVYIAYAEELKAYYSDGGQKAREALEQIEDPSLKAFLKLELDL